MDFPEFDPLVVPLRERSARSPFALLEGRTATAEVIAHVEREIEQRKKFFDFLSWLAEFALKSSSDRAMEKRAIDDARGW